MNKIILTGTLTNQAEFGQNNTGKYFVKFNLAVNDYGQKAPMFIQCYLYGKPAEAVAKYLTKGKKVLVNGVLNVSSYTDKDGIKKSHSCVFAQEIELLSFDKNGNNTNSIDTSQETEYQKYQTDYMDTTTSSNQIGNEDELPF